MKSYHWLNLIFFLAYTLYLIIQKPYIKGYNSYSVIGIGDKWKLYISLLLGTVVFANLAFCVRGYMIPLLTYLFLLLALSDLFTCELDIMPVLCILAYSVIRLYFKQEYLLLLIAALIFLFKNKWNNYMGEADLIIILYFISDYSLGYAIIMVFISAIFSFLVFCILYFLKLKELKSEIPFIFYLSSIYISDILLGGDIIWSILDYYSSLLTAMYALY